MNTLEHKAIAHYAAKNGYIPQLSAYPEIVFKTKGGELKTRIITGLISEYTNDKKEEQKAARKAAALKRKEEDEAAKKRYV